ncbi:MAG: hypothetical protein JWN34_5002 [Bryobacterales bacterium]|nr:hypothetical protein [Bryobacterales bacterium]
MSPEAGEMLMGQIAPRLRSAIPKCVHPVGAEDAEELVQDAIATAAQMLHNVEAAGKKVTAGNIAYFAILHMKSGRRSVCRSRADVMACGTQLDHKSCVLSLEEEVGYDEELGEPIVLGELLASRADDPSVAGSRNVDWEEFLGSHDDRYGVIVRSIAQGEKPAETAKALGINYSQFQCLRLNLEADLMDHMGEQILNESIQAPVWRGDLRVKSERTACLADRRRK